MVVKKSKLKPPQGQHWCAQSMGDGADGGVEGGGALVLILAYHQSQGREDAASEFYAWKEQSDGESVSAR